MEKVIYGISGLPRSGSTLLCNVLAQNPRFHATHTSGCLDVMFMVRNQWPLLIEHKAHPDKEALQRVLRSILYSYHGVDKPVVFDKSRGWTAYIEMLEYATGKKCKILVPIRSIADVMSSMEKLHRETSALRQPPGEGMSEQLYFQMQTVEGRCQYWGNRDNVVGLAYNRIRDAIARGFRDRLHFVSFERFTQNPKEILDYIYEFLEEQPFQHNFDNVEQVTTENDDVHGYVNLHKIKPKISFKPSQAVSIIGADLASEYRKLDLVF